MINYLNIVHREKSGHPPQADRFLIKKTRVQLASTVLIMHINMYCGVNAERTFLSTSVSCERRKHEATLTTKIMCCSLNV